MTNWIVPANGDDYDFERYFDKHDIIYQRQGILKSVALGDTIYIYLSGSIKAVCYRCRALAIEIPRAEIPDDSEYFRNPKAIVQENKVASYMELALERSLPVAVATTLQHLRVVGYKGNMQSGQRLQGRMLEVVEAAFEGGTLPASKYATKEGKRHAYITNRYERSREARQRCIQLHGAKCKVCGFDFEQKYGELGAGFIEVHHRRPISERGAVYEVDPERDLVPLCANCHRMIHLGSSAEREYLTVEELKQHLQ